MLNKSKLNEIFEKKLSIALFDKSEFNEHNALNAVKNFYIEFGFHVPKKYFVFKNTNQIIENFNTWKNDNLSPATSWDWQFPMTNLNGFWFRFMANDNFHLAQKRNFGPNIKDANVSFDGNNEVSKELLVEIWDEIMNHSKFNYYYNLLERQADLLYESKTIEDFLDGLLDETSQEASSEVFFIGTDFKLLYEVTVCEYLIQCHDIKRNQNYINSINDMLTNCGMVISFKESFILCKKVNYSQQRL